MEREIHELRERDDKFRYSAGGIVSNTLTAYSRFTRENVLFLGCIGNDEMGHYYQSQLDPKLGRLQVDEREPTGVVFHVLDGDGVTLDQKSFYGAAENVKADGFQESADFFISNAAIFSIPGAFEEMKKHISGIKKRNGLLVLNCGGARPNRTTAGTLLETTADFVPDIVIGNEAEMCYIGDCSYQDAIQILFPESRLVILTRAEKGSIARLNGQVLPEIPAYSTGNRDKLDGTGAGDAYLGVLLGVLSNTSTNWRESDVLKACNTAAYAASIIMTHSSSQLSEIDAKNARDFYSRFNLSYEECV
ncbi:MAG: carbohydrate kinase family protein [Actinobacteria bacterium]|nr:carbohydrate kinase family protein [Actinomycetota bacterium]